MGDSANAPQVLAVGQDHIPSVACINQSTIELRVDWARLLAALDTYVNKIFAPVWRTPVKIVDGGNNITVPPGCWGLVFLDDTDRQKYLGYHDLTPDGLPLAKVFVRDVLESGGKLSVTASHELGEMLVDPGIHMGARGPDENSWYAYETSDAVESVEFPVEGLPVSNFVYPAWFDPFRKPRSTKFDHRGSCSKPFEIHEGGFMLIFQDGKWTQKAGSAEAEAHFNQATHPRVTTRPQAMRLLSNHDHLSPAKQ